MGGSRLDQLDALEAVTLAICLKERERERVSAITRPCRAMQCHARLVALSALCTVWPDSSRGKWQNVGKGLGESGEVFKSQEFGG